MSTVKSKAGFVEVSWMYTIYMFLTNIITNYTTNYYTIVVLSYSITIVVLYNSKTLLQFNYTDYYHYLSRITFSKIVHFQIRCVPIYFDVTVPAHSLYSIPLTNHVI